MLKHVRVGGALYSVVFAGVAGCRVGGAGCHNGDYIRPVRVKKAAMLQPVLRTGGKWQVVGRPFDTHKVAYLCR